MKTDSIFNWSGGKDSSLALYKVIKEGNLNVRYLLTTVNKEYQRISMHGVREELLGKQAESIGIALKKIYLPEVASLKTYDQLVSEALESVVKEGINVSLFGDIFLEDLRVYREKQLATIGMKAVFPLWKIDTKDLAKEFIDTGFRTVISCVNGKYLDQSFVGREFNEDFLNDLPANVDPCGENGEFHSFVFDGPIFKTPVNFSLGEVVEKSYPPHGDSDGPSRFWYIDLIPK